MVVFRSHNAHVLRGHNTHPVFNRTAYPAKQQINNWYMWAAHNFPFGTDKYRDETAQKHQKPREDQDANTSEGKKIRSEEGKKKIWRKVMARFFVLLSFVVAVFAQSSLARGGIQERLERMQERQHTENNEVCFLVYWL